MVKEVEKKETIREKNYHRYKELLKLQESQSEYMLALERRIINLEILNRVVTKRRLSTGKNLSKKSNKTIVFELLLNKACEVWELTVNELLTRKKDPNLVACRYTIIQILYKRNAYTPVEISQMFYEKGYNIDRTMIYHADTKMNEYFDNNDSMSKRIIENYHNIVNNYMSI